jgi:hypothetical protein
MAGTEIDEVAIHEQDLSAASSASTGPPEGSSPLCSRSGQTHELASVSGHPRKDAAPGSLPLELPNHVFRAAKSTCGPAEVPGIAEQRSRYQLIQAQAPSSPRHGAAIRSEAPSRVKWLPVGDDRKLAEQCLEPHE